MDGDEFGCGYTTSARTGMTSASSNLTSLIGSSAFENFSFAKVWESLLQFECRFSSNWSIDSWFENPFPTEWFGVNSKCQISQGFQGPSLDNLRLSCFSASCGLILICWFGRQLVKQKWFVPKCTSREDFRAEWNFLPTEIQEHVIGRLPYENVYQLKAVSKPLKYCIEQDSFLSLHNELNFVNATLTAPYFFIKAGVWQCAGYDSSLQKWRRLPPLTYLPAYCKPDLDLFKEYLVCTNNGIVCMNVSKSTEDRLIVFNPLTEKFRELPPLNHRRNPVLMHLVVDVSTQSYQVIVAGSSRCGDECLSRMTEVFDSCTWEWKRTGDLPGPDYALNDYQSGVHKDGDLYCLSFLDQDMGRGILRYNLNEGTWLQNWKYHIPYSTNSSILQLVESGGEIYLFSEQENEHRVEHCVDRLRRHIDDNGGVSWSLNNIARSKKLGGRSLEMYPEYACVPFSEHQLCVFNTIDHSGVVYDVWNHGNFEDLQAPPATGFRGENFCSLNPMTFTIEPNFRSKI